MANYYTNSLKSNLYTAQHDGTTGGLITCTLSKEYHPKGPTKVRRARLRGEKLRRSSHSDLRDEVEGNAGIEDSLVRTPRSIWEKI